MFNNKLFVYGDQDVKVPAHLNFGKYMLGRLRRMGDAVALENAETGEKITYKEIIEYAVKLSTALTKSGVEKGDIVALGSEKRLMLVPTALAIMLSGATYTPYDFRSGRAHLRHKLNITKPKYFICTELFWNTNREVIESFDCIKKIFTLDDSLQSFTSVSSLISSVKDIDIDLFEPVNVEGQLDTAIILYSSGTTGMPKGVLLTHLNCILKSLPDDFSDKGFKVAYIYGEWSHNYDCFVTYKMFSLGLKTVYTSQVSPRTVLKACQDHKVNIAFLVPALVNLLAKTEDCEKYNLECLEIVYSRSTPLHVKTMDKLKQRIPSIKAVIQGYGMTEVGELTSENWGPLGPKPGSVGCASPGITIKVINTETKEVLGPNQHGEICIKGPVFMKGYVGVDVSSYLDDEGFFPTGDLGYYDEDGYFYIIDRLKEIIEHGGIKVAPLELETILLLHPAVLEAGVVGKKVPVWGEDPTAFVVLQPGATVSEQELVDFVAPEVAPYMELKGGVIFIPELPRNPRGKILRRKLREMLNEMDSFSHL